MGVTTVSFPQRRPTAGLRLLSDDRLAKLVATGNEAAFEVISERYGPPLYRHCRGILHHHEDASDALQNTLLNAYRALSEKPRDLALRPWLYRIAHNESISLLRRRRFHAELDEAAELSRPGVDVDAETNARLGQLVEDMRELSERQRGVLVMRELNDVSYGDIAAALSISEAAAKQTVHEAHTALHDLAEGRAMECDAVRSTISVGDRRLLRGRKLRAHLRGCDGCRSFEESVNTRRHDLAALAPPIPAALAAALIHSLFGGGGGSAGGGLFGGGALGGGGGGVFGGGGGGLFGGGGGGVFAGSGASAGATASATSVAASAGAGGGAVAGGAVAGGAVAGGAMASSAAAAGGTAATGGGLIAAVTGAAGPALAGAGVVKALVPAAVGLTIGAGALGIAAPSTPPADRSSTDAGPVATAPLARTPVPAQIAPGLTPRTAAHEIVPGAAALQGAAPVDSMPGETPASAPRGDSPGHAPASDNGPTPADAESPPSLISTQEATPATVDAIPSNDPAAPGAGAPADPAPEGGRRWQLNGDPKQSPNVDRGGSREQTTTADKPSQPAADPPVESAPAPEVTTPDPTATTPRALPPEVTTSTTTPRATASGDSAEAPPPELTTPLAPSAP